MLDLADFIKKLRRYRKCDIVNIGTKLLWKVFQNGQSYKLEEVQIINVYAPILIILGMATANDFRKNILNESSFYKLCHDFLEIEDSINDRSFMDHESAQILESLKLKKDKGIPDKYLNLDFIREICARLFVSRIARQQHSTSGVGLDEFYITYDVLLRLNQFTTNEAFNDFQSIFDVTPLQFMRVAFALFTLGIDSNGRITFNGLICDDSVREKLNYDIDTCKLIACKISYEEMLLKKDWYDHGILNTPRLYQKYYPTPLYKTPLIKRGIDSGMDYLIPSPGLFIRAIKDSIFSQLCINKKLSAKLGEAIEGHILYVLRSIFGEDNVSVIPRSTNSRSADFCIELPKYILIIECKSMIGSYNSLSVMLPEDIAEIWSRLYNACEQCSISAKEYQNSSKTIILIVLIADHITVEAEPFQYYAAKSSIFEDMGIGYIKFISWHKMLEELSIISIERFLDRLVKNKKHTATIDSATQNFEEDTPAHNYEFLKEVSEQIWANILA